MNQRRQPANEELMHQNQQPIANEISEQRWTLESVLLAKNNAYGNSAGQAPLFVKGATQETAIMVRANDKIRSTKELRRRPGNSMIAVESEIPPSKTSRAAGATSP